MGTSLNGLNPASTYQALIKVGNNTNLNTTLKTLSDGAGNDLPMQASTTAINFTGTVSGVASGVSGAIQFSNGSAFASDASNFFWDDTNKRLGVRTNAPSHSLQVISTNQTDVIRFKSQYTQNGYLWTGNTQIGLGSSPFGDNTGNHIVLNNIGALIGAGGQGTATAKLQVVGSGSTSATTSLLVQNSSGSTLLSLRDDKVADFNSGTILGVGTLFTQVVTTGYINSSGNAYSVMRTNNSTGNATFDQFVAIGTTSAPNASAALDVVSTTKGFLPPRMTTTQKNAIASPAEGLQMYDSTAKSPAYYDGTNWGYTGGALQNAAGNSGTLNISFAAGNIVNLTLNANTTLAFSNAVIGTYIIQVTQGATGANVLTYPASVKWAGGTAPTLTTTVGKTDILTFYYDGTNYYGNYSLNY